MSQSPSYRAEEDSLVTIAARRLIRRLRGQATTPELGRLLLFQAAGAAGDALVALALAGSLFFSVPEQAARGRVALYLGLTVAPFAVVAPFLSTVLDRHRGSMRITMVVVSLGRGSLAWLLASRLESLYLFPLAFGILVLSRAALVVRGAYLPSLVPAGHALVGANAALSKVSALAGIVVLLPGLLLVRWVGPDTELLLTAMIFFVGLAPAVRLPSARGRRTLHERRSARRDIRSPAMRQAVVAVTGMRLLVGFLVFHLAFALRREEFGSLKLGLLVGAAALGALVGAMVSPWLRRKLHEEGMLIASLTIAGATGLAVGRWFSVTSAAILVFVFGVSSGAAKVAFDAIVQRSIPEGARGWAFSRFESILQLAWVAGALVPLLLPVPAGPGVVVAGFVAVALAALYVVGRRKLRRAGVP